MGHIELRTIAEMTPRYILFKCGRYMEPSNVSDTTTLSQYADQAENVGATTIRVMSVWRVDLVKIY